MPSLLNASLRLSVWASFRHSNWSIDSGEYQSTAQNVEGRGRFRMGNQKNGMEFAKTIRDPEVNSPAQKHQRDTLTPRTNLNL